MRLARKVVVVTGGASGFGAAMARTFAREGASVAVLDVDAGNGERVAAEIAASGVPGRARFVRCDVSRRADVARAVADVLAGDGRIDAYVNNAGVTHRPQPFLDVTEDDFERVYAVNVKALFLSALEVIPVFRAQGGGVMVNIASTAGLRPRPGLTVYNSSKGAAILFSKSLALEYAAEGIRVCAVCPVAGETPLLPAFMGGDTPELRARFVASIPLGRLAQPSDVADTVLFLISDEAGFLTGIALEVDGGRCV